MPSKIPAQVAKLRVPLAAPSVLTLIQTTSGKRQKTYIGYRTFAIIVLMPYCSKIEKYEIWLPKCFLEVLLEVWIQFSIICKAAFALIAY